MSRRASPHDGFLFHSATVHLVEISSIHVSLGIIGKTTRAEIRTAYASIGLRELARIRARFIEYEALNRAKSPNHQGGIRAAPNEYDP